MHVLEGYGSCSVISHFVCLSTVYTGCSVHFHCSTKVRVEYQYFTIQQKHLHSEVKVTLNEFLSKFANLAGNAPKVLEMNSKCSK